MAPDLNSLPPSPFRSHHATSSSSRRSSELRNPPAASATPTSPQPPILSFQDHLASTMGNPGGPTVDNTGVGVGPGPLRHPRPLTAADLYMQMEKEQEAVVNRLTRELTALRQQTASVASNTSSTSAGIADATADLNSGSLMTGAHHPTQSRRHRSSSSLSRTANPSLSSTAGSTTGSTLGATAGVTGSSTSGIAPPRDVSTQYGYSRDPLSRQSSVASRRSEASSPSLSSSLIQNDHFPNMYAHRPTGSMSRQPPSIHLADTNAVPRSHISPVARYEEVDRSRIELEDVKRENDALKRRIRELERTLNSRPPEEDRTRSGSVSTSASIPRHQGRDRPLDNDDDGVGIGESAASVGIGGGH